MTVKIHIPSSEAPDRSHPDEPWMRPPPGPASLIGAGILVVGMMGVLVTSVVSGLDSAESSVPAPFEASDPAPIGSPTEAWTRQRLPGSGEVLAMGTAHEVAVAVTTDWQDVLVWERDDDVWRVSGSPELGSVESAHLMDDRLLLVGHLEGIPTVWDWVNGSQRRLFQPTSGRIAGTWSVGGRLLVAVAQSDPSLERAIGNGRTDRLWLESIDGEFAELELIGLESVLAVAGDSAGVAVGGRDAEGRAAIGFLHDTRVLAHPLPGAVERSAVTDLEAGPSSTMVLVSTANRPGGMSGELRASDRDWERVADTPELVGIEVVGDTVFGATPDGRLSVFSLEGSDEQVPSIPSWSYGRVVGIDAVGDQPVLYGQSEGSPAYAGPSTGSREVALPHGGWERYHSETSDGFDLIHIGSREFATRDGKLFSRGWNGDRWHQAGPRQLDVFGTPMIIELDWGLVLVPPAGGLWTSAHGGRWSHVEGSDTARMDEVATDGDVLVGFTHLGAGGGPMSDVTVLDKAGEITRLTLPYLVVGPHWVEGVGFVGTVAPPESGYATSQDGIEWDQRDGTGLFDRVIGFGGSVYLSIGKAVDSVSPPAEVPSGDGRLHYEGGVLMWADTSGSTWIHTGEDWQELGFGVVDGLPVRPHEVILRGSTVFAMVDGLDGVAETYFLELD